MQVNQLTAQLSISAQLSPKELAQAAENGFTTIICNRPDQESGNEAPSEIMQTECEEHGMQWCYLPVTPQQITDQQVVEFGRLLDESAGQVLAYCRTGMRAAKLWALSQAGNLPLSEILTSASSAGYDLTDLSDRINNLAK
ncbi:MAG: TIGR01244 family phosphatase [Oceanospirillaceae bacterium]|nr:TIGR01244 family phosphatase [Oceanospirillaceae bacterium]